MYFNSHAHVERDNLWVIPCPISYNFNSHAHVERDQKNWLPPHYGKISTHTLTWSVTKGGMGECQRPLNFNSHAHVERDCTQFGVDKCPKYFNSHAHVERDSSYPNQYS